LTGDTLAAAIEFAKAGQIDGLTFAPLNKQALYKGGWHFPDEHKMFAHLLDFKGLFSEMNVLDNQWMTRATSHVSLREAVEQIRADLRFVAAFPRHHVDGRN
jgi:4-hydroxy-L-threonine phosphate dehydrogenase PdxA